MKFLVLLSAACVGILPGLAMADPANGFYGAEGLGGNFAPNATATGNGGSATLNFKPGMASTFALGYGLGDSFRTELELGIRRSNLSHFGSAASAGSASSYSLMENVLYDFDRGLPITPHVGAGLGVASTRIGFATIPAGAPQVNGHETTFAYQAIAGFDYPILPQMALGLDYRFFSEPDVAVKSASYALHDNDLMVTLRYQFAAPAAAQAMTDAPVVAVAQAPTPPMPSHPVRPPAPMVAQMPLAPPPSVAVAKPVAAPPPPLPTQAAAEQPANGQYAVHLGSYRKTNSILPGWHEYQAKFPELLNEMEARVSTVDLGERGVFYRVKAGPFPTAATAKATCRDIAAKGYDCDVMDFGGTPIEHFSQTAAR